MNIGVICIFPEIFSALNYGITGKAIKKKLINISYFNLKNYTKGPSDRLDDKPYGGGPGMIIRYEPLKAAILDAKAHLGEQAEVIYLSPRGKKLQHNDVLSFAKARQNIILICGRYEGIDERVIEKYVSYELSIGDYILSGGEYASLVILDSITRLIDGALGNQDSIHEDTFTDNKLEHPQYTRPREIDNLRVPEVLFSGNHEDIVNWKKDQSLEITKRNRPDLIQFDKISSKE